MEHRGFPVRAYNLAILAMKNVHLAYNQDKKCTVCDRFVGYFETLQCTEPWNVTFQWAS
jgi:hypothetical protein